MSSPSTFSSSATPQGASLAGSAPLQGGNPYFSALKSSLSTARCFIAAARKTASGSLDESIPSRMAARNTMYASQSTTTSVTPETAAQKSSICASAVDTVKVPPESVNAPAWRSIADFLSLQFLRDEMARRRASERSARGPACGDTRQRSGEEPSGHPDGNHGEMI